ncbi:MAG: hypothetical protein JHC28_00815 [Thermoprotei archaeon]|nr:hypothetical protein [Thermoprotei archaeon]
MCGLRECPLLARSRGVFKAYSSVVEKLDIAAPSPPSAIVGERGYPLVPLIYNIVPESGIENASLYDNPKLWHGRLGLKEIVELRSSLLGGILKVRVSDPWKLYEKEISLAAVSLSPIETEARFRRPPTLKLSFDSVLRPNGLLSPAEKIKVNSSPKLDKNLERMIWDDVLAKDALVELFLKGTDVYLLERALSLGLLGKRNNKKLVPTRWAITAVDDTISEFIKRKIQEFKVINEINVFSGEYLYNKFVIVLIPGTYEGAWIEIWHPKSIWAMNSSEAEVMISVDTIREGPLPPDGGFSAARLGVLEYLFNKRKTAKFIIIREVFPEYIVPVGNWHIRETVRNALKSTPTTVADYNELANVVEQKINSKVGVNLFKEMLKKMISQKSILDYLP